MGSPPSTFERVYGKLKQWLMSGHFRSGGRLEPAPLSEELNSSVTPVRDALHRLTGERLVEAPRNEGFRAVLMTEVMLRQLYAWHRDLLLMALLSRSAQETPPPAHGDERPSGSAYERAIFTKLVGSTGNLEHLHAIQSTLERLAPFSRLEDLLLDDLELEAEAISRAVEAGDRRALRSLLVAYHRRRNRIVPELIELRREPISR